MKGAELRGHKRSSSSMDHDKNPPQTLSKSSGPQEEAGPGHKATRQQKQTGHIHPGAAYGQLSAAFVPLRGLPKEICPALQGRTQLSLSKHTGVISNTLQLPHLLSLDLIVISQRCQALRRAGFLPVSQPGRCACGTVSWLRAGAGSEP